MTFEPLSVFRDLTDRVSLLARSDLSKPIDACPGWTASELLGHLGQVYAMVSTIMAARSIEYVKPGPEAEPPSRGIDRWFDERRKILNELLETTDAATPVWTWGAEKSAAFYRRRMVHETVVHLADLETAHGSRTQFERDIAIDGIDEFFEVVFPFSVSRGRSPLPSGSLHLHATDGPGEWFVRIEGSTALMSHEHAKGDVAWRGSVNDLYLAIWGRVMPNVERLGDPVVSDQWAGAAP